MKKAIFPPILLLVMLFCSCGAGQAGASSLAESSSTTGSGPTAAGEMPADFGFVLVCDFLEVDTFSGTIKNTYADSEGYPGAVADFSFTETQMQEIYEAFVLYDIQQLPEEIDPDKEYMTIPPTFYQLSYKVSGTSQTVACATGAGPDQAGISKENNRFVKFMRVVSSHIYSSEAYRSLPEFPRIE